jgi:cytochrome c peroxidase
MTLRLGVVAVALAAGSVVMLVVADRSSEAAAPGATAAMRAAFKRPAGLPDRGGVHPSDAMADLGRALFEDARLSGDGTMSCATCHQAQLGFADGQPRRMGRNGKPLARNTPHLWNLAWSETLFWDGRAKTLEQQAAGPIESPVEMAGSLPVVVEHLKADPKMAEAFARVFPQRPAIDASGRSFHR